jgi:hypothetical protein
VVTNKGKIPFIILKDDFSDYTLGKRLTSKKKEEVADGLTAMLNQFKAWGHSPGTLRTDAENVFKFVTSTVNGLGWRMEFTQPGRHERKVERFIRDVRDRVRTVIDSLKYRLPKKLYSDLVASIIATSNMLPSARSSPITPQEIVVGVKPDLSLGLRARFWEIAIFKDRPKGRHINKRRIRDHFGERFLLVKSKHSSCQREEFLQGIVIKITEEIKEEIAKVSSASLVPEQSIFADSVGAVTDEETEEHINPTNLTPLHRAPTESEPTQASEVAPQETLPADSSTTNPLRDLLPIQTLEETESHKHLRVMEPFQ